MTIHRARPSVTGLSLALLISLTACSSESETEEPTTESTPSAEAQETTEEPAEETTEAAETTEEPADDTEESSAPAAGETSDGEVSPPGTAVAVGESAVTHVQSGQEGDEFYGFALLNTTVTSIEAGDPSYFEQFDNAEELEGLVPYFIIAEHEIIEFEGEPNDNMTPRLTGMLENSQDATTLVGFSGVGEECQVDLYPERTPGNVATVCTVVAGDEGGPGVTSVEWRGDDEIDGMSSDGPYYQDPVTWTQ